MTDPVAGVPSVPPTPLAPPPAPVAGPPRLVYDGAFIGPMLPPDLPAAGGQAGAITPSAQGIAPALPPVTDAVLAIPLGTRRLVGQALDLLTRQDAGLRSASFYIGLIALVTIAPVVMLLGLAAATDATLFDPEVDSSLNVPILFAGFLAMAGYLVAGVEARALATAVIGGRAEGRPLRLRESIAIARRRFWRVLAANVVVGIVAGIASAVIQVPLSFALGNVEAINYGISLVVGTLAAAPFVYVPTGVVLGEVGAFEAISRSIRLAGLRKRLALVIALFSIASQFIILFGLSIGGDVVFRLVDGTGITESFPPALVIPGVAALAFALGTLLFLVEAITVAPAVHAFEALTHYTHGLEAGRANPAPGSTIWSPWFTPGLALAAVLALLLVVGGVAGLPG